MSYFENIQTIKFGGKTSTDPFTYKWYDPDNKEMREKLKFAMSYWHTLCGNGTDMFGRGTANKSFGGSDPVDEAKKKADAGFELMGKLGIDYFCFHDRDMAPEFDSLADTNAALDEVSDYIKAKMDENGTKCLWGTAKLFDHPRYMHGAGTSPNADAYAYGIAQVKKAIETTVKLGGTGYVYWGGREGYETLLNTDMGLELDNMARFLSMTAEYGRKIGFKGDYYIEPKPKEPTKHQYDFDAATCLAFLRKYGLDKEFKLNIEANHATLAGHTFQHELATARINGAFGSIDANQGDLLLGWDTDQFPTNIYETTMCMVEVIKAGGFTNGGLNFDAKTRRGSFTKEDLVLAYIAGIDSFALGLILAEKLVADGRIDKFVEERYASWQTGIGAKIISGSATIEEIEQYALSLGEVKTTMSGRQEYLENILNSILFA